MVYLEWFHSSQLNSLWLSDVIWWQGSRSTLAQVSHYLNQRWLMISEVLWHSPDNNFTRKYLRHLSLKWVWNLLIWDCSQITQGPMRQLRWVNRVIIIISCSGSEQNRLYIKSLTVLALCAVNRHDWWYYRASQSSRCLIPSDIITICDFQQ